MVGDTSDAVKGGTAKKQFGTPSSSPMSTEGPGIYEQVIGAFFKGQHAQQAQGSSSVKPKFKLVEGRLPKVCLFIK